MASFPRIPRRSADAAGRSVSGSLVGSSVAESGDDAGLFPGEGGGDRGGEHGRARALSGASGRMAGVLEEDDEDRVDARNAASRLAASTF